jgi:uncharacterized membrane protein
MLRKRIFRQFGKQKTRGTEVYRVETLSDAVFAFSVSLLIVSLEVPGNFAELKAVMNNFLPFFATVALIFFFWYLQNEYFRNYGLNDGVVIFLNLALLAPILFYAFPLKFLFTLLFSWITGINYFSGSHSYGESVLTQEEFPELIFLFSIGYVAIWLVFFLLYHHAYKRKRMLDLSPQETYYLFHQRLDSFVQVLIGVFSILFALLKQPVLSGICFLLIPLWLIANNILFKTKLKHLK